MTALQTVVFLFFMTVLVVYPLGVAFVIARAAHQRRGLVAGIATAAVTIAGWCQAPAPTFVVSLAVLIWLRCRRPPLEPEIELPCAKVV